MAAFTSKATGNWSASNQTTWNETGVPGSGDTVTIAAGHTVTIDANTTTGGGKVGSGSGTATLVLATGVTLTLNGNLQIGANVDGQRGAFTFSAGSTLALGSSNFCIGNGIIRSMSTSVSWAYVTGTGNVGAALPGNPAMDVVLTHVSFQNTGYVMFPCGSTRVTGLTPQIDVQHCTFVGNAYFVSGLSASTGLSVKQVCDYCDFRNLGASGTPPVSIKIVGVCGDATDTFSFSHNTLSHSSSTITYYFGAKRGVTADGNVIYKGYQCPTADGGGGNTVSNSFFGHPDDQASGANMIQVNNNSTGRDTVDLCYFHSNAANPHTINSTNTAVSYVPHTIKRCVFDSGDAETDHIIVNSGSCDVLNNLLLGRGDLVGSASAGNANYVVNVHHNTAYCSANAMAIQPSLLMQETSANARTYNLRSNLAATGSTSPTIEDAVYDRGRNGLTIAVADYNAFQNVTTPYGNVTVISGKTHDITHLSDPRFADESRCLAEWDAICGSGIGTNDAAKAYLLNINGFNATSKTQSDTPSDHGPADLVSWVREGFKVGDSALRNAGHDGATIGACDHQACGGDASMIHGNSVASIGMWL